MSNNQPDETGEDQEFLGTTSQRYHANSRPNRYARLEVSESDSESIVFGFDETNREDFDRRCNNLRNSVNKARHQCTERTAMEFEMDSGYFFTRAGDIVFTVVVTRVR